MAISYVELNGSGKGKTGRQGATEQRFFKVAWSDRIAFCAWLTGYALPSGDGYGKVVKPQQHPAYPGLYCVDTEREPIGKAGGTATLITYPYAKITATYSTLKYDPSDPTEEALLRETSMSSLQMITLPQGGFKWADNGSPITEPVGRLMGVSEIRVTRYHAPSKKTTTLEALYGKVNLGYFRGRAPGTMLFMGVDTDSVLNTQGEWEHTIVFKFHYRNIEWNKFLKPDGKTFAYLWSTDNSTMVYTEASFASITNWTQIS